MTDRGRRIVVMGVAGAGKTTIGARLADRLGCEFVDADSAHPPENIAKMAAGFPLTDDDRRPWLLELLRRLRTATEVVVTCSALRRSYRDVLRAADGVTFVFLELDPETARDRLECRAGHFMAPGMVDSQFEVLERPEPDESDVVVVDATRPTAELLDLIGTRLGA